MSGQFKVGDVVVGRGFRINTKYNDMEGVVIEGLAGRSGTNFTTLETWTSNCYIVKWKNGHTAQANPENLRLKRPPSTDESESHQAMLDCIERAKRGAGVTA